jgi:hypothetical protein
MEIIVVWEGQDLHVTYDRAAFTIEMTEGVYTMPIRQRLIQVLLSWDLLRGGQPWQPPPQDDPGWDAIVQAARPDGADVALSTADERSAAYESAWNDIIVQLPRAFVRAVDTGVLDDFLGLTWRGAISANGSGTMAGSVGSIGGTNI